MNRTVLAIFKKGIWIQVWNLDYDTAVQEAEADTGRQEICFIEDGKAIGFTSSPCVDEKPS